MLRPRSAEHYAITSRSFEPVAVLGAGKSASAYLARKGPLVRVFRITKAPPFDVDRAHFEDVRTSLRHSHALAKHALRVRVPRVVETFVVENRRGKAIAVASIMEFVAGPSLQDQLNGPGLLPSHVDDLKRLFRMLWTQRTSHGDAAASNLLYDAARRRYVCIDTDSVRQHPTPAYAKARDLPTIRSSMPPRLAAELARVVV